MNENKWTWLQKQRTMQNRSRSVIECEEEICDTNEQARGGNGKKNLQGMILCPPEL